MGGIVSGVKSAFFGGAEAEAGAAGVSAAQAGIEEQRSQFESTQEQFAPFSEAGVSALQTEQALLGQLGPEAGAAAQAQFLEGPGQAFLRERGERALLRNASAIGGLGGGNIRSALQEQGIGFAAQQFGDFQNRLADLSRSGQTAVSNLGELGARKATQISGLLTQEGQARASGILGQAAGIRRGIGQVAGAFI